MSGDKWAEDYRPVAERIEAFYADHPTGSLHSQIYEYSAERVTVVATVYRDPDETRPAGMGSSSLAIPGKTAFTRGSELENAETSAWGRALESIGYGKGPSREEMADIEQPAAGGASASSPRPPQAGKPRTSEEDALLNELVALVTSHAQLELLAEAVKVPKGRRANAGELRAMIEIARKPAFPPTSWPEPGTAAFLALTDYERGAALAWHAQRKESADV
jgi:hypothetical protein